MHKPDVKIIKQESLYEGFLALKRYHLKHTLFAGGWTSEFTREIVVRHHAAAVIPYDPILDRIVLLEQFRAGGLNEKSHPWFIEVVAGLLQLGETPEQVVRREAQEEAGLEILDLWPIYDYWASPGMTNEHISLFCGKVDASKAGGLYGLAHEHEDIRAFTVSSQEAFDRVQKGDIKNAICLIALLWLQLNKEMLRAKWLG